MEQQQDGELRIICNPLSDKDLRRAIFPVGRRKGTATCALCGWLLYEDEVTAYWGLCEACAEDVDAEHP